MEESTKLCLFYSRNNHQYLQLMLKKKMFKLWLMAIFQDQWVLLNFSKKLRFHNSLETQKHGNNGFFHTSMKMRKKMTKKTPPIWSMRSRESFGFGADGKELNVEDKEKLLCNVFSPRTWGHSAWSKFWSPSWIAQSCPKTWCCPVGHSSYKLLWFWMIYILISF